MTGRIIFVLFCSIFSTLPPVYLLVLSLFSSSDLFCSLFQITGTINLFMLPFLINDPWNNSSLDSLLLLLSKVAYFAICILSYFDHSLVH